MVVVDTDVGVEEVEGFSVEVVGGEGGGIGLDALGVGLAWSPDVEEPGRFGLSSTLPLTIAALFLDFILGNSPTTSFPNSTLSSSLLLTLAPHWLQSVSTLSVTLGPHFSHCHFHYVLYLSLQPFGSF